MALCVPAAAWIEASALMIVLVLIAALGIGVVLWWRWHQNRAQDAERTGRPDVSSFDAFSEKPAWHRHPIFV